MLQGRSDEGLMILSTNSLCQIFVHLSRLFLPLHFQVPAVEGLYPASKLHVLGFRQLRIEVLSQQFRQPVLLGLQAGKDLWSTAPAVARRGDADFLEASIDIASPVEVAQVHIGDE